MALSREGLDEDSDFAALLALDGAAYERLKARVLARPGRADTYAARYGEAPEWQVRAMAFILLAWTRHAAAYTAFVDDLRAEDLDEARRKIIGVRAVWQTYSARAQREFGADALPLCWEMILKHAGDMEWERLGTYVWTLNRMPDIRSRDVLFELANTTSNLLLAETALRATLTAPDAALRDRLAQQRQFLVGRARIVGMLVEELDEPA